MPTQPPAPPLFTPREREIIAAVCKGMTYQAIARSLAISPHTVDTYMRRIKQKACVTSRAELIVLAIRQEL